MEQAWKLAQPLVENEGMEVVDVEYQRERRGAVLRFFIDREGGVSLDDLAPLSRRLGDVIDAHDIVPGPYTLELSSPGINRRLRRPEHFRRYIGKRIRVRTAVPLAGRRSFVGPLQAVETGGIVVGSSENMQFIRFEDIAHANYEHDFDHDAMLKPGKRSEER